MIDCEACGRKSQLFLCTTCQSDLGQMLHGLAGRTVTDIVTGYERGAAGWIEMLQDAAWGRTRLGESARRSTDKGSPMLCNQPASELLSNVHDMLIRWVETINVHTETLNVEDTAC